MMRCRWLRWHAWLRQLEVPYDRYVSAWGMQVDNPMEAAMVFDRCDRCGTLREHLLFPLPREQSARHQAELEQKLLRYTVRACTCACTCACHANATGDDNRWRSGCRCCPARAPSTPPVGSP